MNFTDNLEEKKSLFISFRSAIMSEVNRCFNLDPAIAQQDYTPHVALFKLPLDSGDKEKVSGTMALLEY